MPNHVINKVQFKCTFKEAAKIYNDTWQHATDEFDFGRLIWVNSSDQEECRKAWGTKWNAYESSFDFKDGTGYITFNSAWSPPYKVINVLMKMYNLTGTYHYCCESIEVWGVFTYQNSDLQEQQHGQPEDENACRRLWGDQLIEIPLSELKKIN